MFENPRRGRQARNFAENDPKILDLKSSSEHIIFRKLSLGAPDIFADSFHVLVRLSRLWINTFCVGWSEIVVSDILKLKPKFSKLTLDLHLGV